jgi:hypothetical protein
MVQQVMSPGFALWFPLNAFSARSAKIPFEGQGRRGFDSGVAVNAITILGFVATLGHHITQRFTKNSQC